MSNPVSALVAWFSALFDFQVKCWNWWVELLGRGWILIQKLGNGWAWIFSVIAVLVGMFVDVLGMVLNGITSMSLNGFNVPSNPFGSGGGSLGAAYGFLDACFCVHEIIAGFAVLMTLFLFINGVRIVRGVLSIIQVGGTGVQP